MQLSDDLKLIAWPTRVRFDEDDNTPERLAFELEVNGERMVAQSGADVRRAMEFR
ncbi:hypothetical protein [Pseudomonas amygdali]|uniref:hypothetical protein n=1 Tax=Pseudomonas amygdali TaxID=47877 RepID=UPI001F397E3B|nr:hypothetical protein [Pseudomonas amygdali]